MNTPLLDRLLPFTDWLFHYRKENLAGDLTAGAIVAVMLIPQSLAYAMLAGLPPQYGLYASILPLFVYGLLGSSRVLSVGPVAVISLLTAAALAPFAEPFSAEYIGLALLLAFMTGVIQLALGAFRAGFVANLLSHPVVAGFITGSSVLIILSQLKHIFGVSTSAGHLPYETAVSLAQALPDTNWTTLAFGIAAIGLLVLTRSPLRKLLRRAGLSDGISLLISRTGPALLVLAGIGAVAAFGLDANFGVAVVGSFATGLPGITLPSLDLPVIGSLAPAALLIVLAGYVESVSVGRSLGARRKQAIDPNQELLALGAANVASGLTGGFPVTGGFSRSVVNYDAGANTGLASLVTAGLIAVIALFAAPLFAGLPQVVLGATVIVAVSSLVNFRELLHLWRYSKGDGALMGLTILTVLGFGIEIGIAAGVAASLLAHLARVSKPHMAVVGRVAATEHFRNVKRHAVETYAGTLLVRIDENLFFVNTRGVQGRLLKIIADNSGIRHVVLVLSAVNYVDASALATLESLVEELRGAGITLHLAEVKGPVMDRFERVAFTKRLHPGQVFLSTHAAVKELCQPVALSSAA